MEFLDSLDLDTKDKKAHRVRSWYLYEQYKSLEKHQTEAAQRLKDRSYQDKILRQELSERRARRKLYDQFGLCQSDSRIRQGIESYGSFLSKTLSMTNDEFFESFSEQEIERVTQETEFDDNYSGDMTIISHLDTVEDFTGTSEPINSISCSDSVNSVVEKLPPTDTCEEFTKTNEMTPNSLAEDLNKQMDAVKQSLENLERLTKFEDESKSSESESACLTNNCKMSNESFSNKQSKFNIVLIWSRLVSFAYQVVQLNHGNCYSDYSSQFLTAVLACDVLRRGVNRMCSNLQPYVLPIKFETEDANVTDNFYCGNNKEIKKLAQSRKSKKTIDKKMRNQSKRSGNCPRHAHKNHSLYTWQHSSRPRYSLKSEKRRQASEVLRCTTNPCRETSSSNCSLKLRSDRRNVMSKKVQRGCHCMNGSLNPMLEIGRYINRIIKDTEDYM